MPWIDVGATDIHYDERGTGTPLVFIHGALSSAETWYRQLGAFSNRYRAIAYDSVNHGLSSNSPRDEPEPDRADELEGFLGALGVDRPILAGQSMGGMTIVRWAIRHPDAAPALVISGMGIPDAPRQAPSPLEEKIGDEIIFLGVAESFTPEFYAAEPRLVDRYIRVRSTATRLEAQRHPRTTTAINPPWEPQALAEGAGAIKSPMLILAGELDYLRPWAERLHELVPGSRYEILKSVAHSAHYEKAEEYVRLVEDFLKAHGL